MKVVITWGSGFLWKHLVRLYYEKWYKVISCQRKKIPEIEEITYKYFDYTLPINIDADFQNVEIFIHCGSCTDYTALKKYMLQQNVASLRNIKKISSSAKHFIYISSSSVYQWIWWKISADIVIDENNLQNSYSYSKFKAEEYIKNNFKNKYISILRPRAIYGDGDTTLIPQVLKNSIFWYLLLPGDGNSKTSISNIDELCNYTLNISQNNNWGIYNFSSEIQSYDQIYKKIQSDYGKRGIMYVPLWVVMVGYYFNRNKYSYIIDTFWKDKILKTDK